MILPGFIHIKGMYDLQSEWSLSAQGTDLMELRPTFKISFKSMYPSSTDN